MTIILRTIPELGTFLRFLLRIELVIGLRIQRIKLNIIEENPVFPTSGQLGIAPGKPYAR